MIVLKYHDKKGLTMLSTVLTASMVVTERLDRRTNEPVVTFMSIVHFCHKIEIDNAI